MFMLRIKSLNLIFYVFHQFTDPSTCNCPCCVITCSHVLPQPVCFSLSSSRSQMYTHTHMHTCTHARTHTHACTCIPTPHTHIHWGWGVGGEAHIHAEQGIKQINVIWHDLGSRKTKKTRNVKKKTFTSPFVACQRQMS